MSSCGSPDVGTDPFDAMVLNAGRFNTQSVELQGMSHGEVTEEPCWMDLTQSVL